MRPVTDEIPTELFEFTARDNAQDISCDVVQMIINWLPDGHVRIYMCIFYSGYWGG